VQEYFQIFLYPTFLYPVFTVVARASFEVWTPHRSGGVALLSQWRSLPQGLVRGGSSALTKIIDTSEGKIFRPTESYFQLINYDPVYYPIRQYFTEGLCLSAPES